VSVSLCLYFEQDVDINLLYIVETREACSSSYELLVSLISLLVTVRWRVIIMRICITDYWPAWANQGCRLQWPNVCFASYDDAVNSIGLWLASCLWTKLMSASTDVMRNCIEYRHFDCVVCWLAKPTKAYHVDGLRQPGAYYWLYWRHYAARPTARHWPLPGPHVSHPLLNEFNQLTWSKRWPIYFADCVTVTFARL